MDLGPGVQLAFTSTVSWQDGTLRVREEHDVLRAGKAPQRSGYDFVMRPWSENELRQRLGGAGFHTIEIGPGVGRKTSDRLLVVAVRQ